jgi:hypothetical protein
VARRYAIAERVLFRWKQELMQVTPLFVAVEIADANPVHRGVLDQRHHITFDMQQAGLLPAAQNCSASPFASKRTSPSMFPAELGTQMTLTSKRLPEAVASLFPFA